MKKKIILASLVLAVAVGGAWGWFIAWPTFSIEKVARAGLKDPDSAKFTHVTYYPETKSGCGLVNAKNSMGGYVGNVVFIAGLDGFLEFKPNRDSSVGTAQERLAAVSEEIKFLELQLKRCPEK